MKPIFILKGNCNENDFDKWMISHMQSLENLSEWAFQVPYPCLDTGWH